MPSKNVVKSVNSQAHNLVESILGGGDSRRALAEGHVIILNGDPDQNAAALTHVLGSQGGDNEIAPQERPEPTGGAKDKFDIKRNGKRWRFIVHRNEEGQIQEIEVMQS